MTRITDDHAAHGARDDIARRSSFSRLCSVTDERKVGESRRRSRRVMSGSTIQSGEALRVSPIPCLGATQRANYGDVAASSQLGQRGAEINPVSRMCSACQLIRGELAASDQLSQQLLLKRIHIQPL